MKKIIKHRYLKSLYFGLLTICLLGMINDDIDLSCHDLEKEVGENHCETCEICSVAHIQTFDLIFFPD